MGSVKAVVYVVAFTLILACVAGIYILCGQTFLLVNHPKCTEWTVNYSYTYTDDVGNLVYSIFSAFHPWNTTCMITFSPGDIPQNVSTRYSPWCDKNFSQWNPTCCAYMTKCPGDVLIDTFIVVLGLLALLIAASLVIARVSNDDPEYQSLINRV